MATSPSPRAGAFRDGNWALWAFGLITIGMLCVRIPEVFDGFIPGIDDMMRLQQVRDLLAGQSWFLVDQSRLLTPEGGEMHWSRLPDLFLAGVIFLAQPLIGQSAAEALAMGLWPLILLAFALTFLSLIMRRLGLNLIGQLAGLYYFGSSAAIYNFWPGRIDHHGFVVVLVLAGLTAVLSRQMTARSGIVLALSVTAALSIALEGLPYVAGLIALMGLFWVVRGHREGVRLAAFGVALMILASLFFAFDAPGIGDRRMVCDAYGTSHWAGLTIGGLLLALLGVFGGWLDTWQKRLLAGAIAGGITIAIFAWVNPACLGDPYAAVPDTVRETWLERVREAKPLSNLLLTEPVRVIWVYGFLGTASIASILMIQRASPERRLARLGVGLLFALAIVATIWQVRGQSFSHVFAAIGAGWLVGILFDHWWVKRGPVPLMVTVSAAILLSPETWRILGERLGPELINPPQAVSRSMECIQANNYEDMATRTSMRVHTPIDLGISVLVRTSNEVFVGPYHRNIKGIERANLVLIGPPDEAQGRLLDLGATHFAYCRGLGETNDYGERWPNGLAAQLNRDEIPEWLEPVDGKRETEGVVRLYRILPE